MVQNVIKIGNSFGVTLPRDFVVQNKIKAGSKVEISISAKLPNTTKYELITDSEFLDLIKEVESQYGSALDKLANL